MNLPFYIKYNIILIIGLSLLIYLSLFYNVFSAVLYLNPATGLVDTENFDLVISLDPQGSQDISSFNIYLKYNPSNVEFVSVEPMGASVLNKKLLNSTDGILNLQGAINSVVQDTTSIASIKFKVLSNNVNSEFNILNNEPYISSVLSSSQEELLSSPIPTSKLLLNISSNDFNSDDYVGESTPTQKAVPSTGFVYYTPIIFGIFSILLSLFLNSVYTKS